MNNSSVVTLFSLNQNPQIKKEEAVSLVPHLLNITRNTKKELNALNSQLEVFKGQTERRQAVQTKINITTQKWSEKMKRLGTTPVGMLKVKISTDQGNFYWEFPHDRLHLE